jgi:hypothetical protein
MQAIVEKRGYRLLPLLALALAAMILLVLSDTAEAGLTRGGFEIDANDTVPPPPGAPMGFPDLDNPFYSGQTVIGDGLTVAADDWAQGSGNEGVFISAPLFGPGALNEDGGAAGDCQDGLDNGGGDGADANDPDCHPVAGAHETASLDCYDFHVDLNPDINGAPAFICDGSSSSSFDGNGGDEVTQVERSIVSPSGTTQANTWPITAGNNAPKTDLSHGYFLFRLGDSVCDADTDNDDPFFIMGGNRGNGEGTAFWGFEFNQVPPAGLQDLIDQTDTDLVFKHDENGVIQDGRSSNETNAPAGDDNGDSDSVDRGDLMVSFTLTGGGLNPALDVFEFDEDAANQQFPQGRYVQQNVSLTCTGATNNGVAHSVLETNRPLNTDGDASIGDSQDRLHDIEAPPWGVPTCDPTFVDDAGNSCRLAVGNSTASTVNKSPSACDNTPGTGGTKIQCHALAQLSFAEAVLDLEGLGIPLSCFNSMIFTSRSSHPLDSADLKDVGGAEVEICGTKDGVKYHDRNADGDRDTGEEGLGGWDIHIFGDNSVHDHFSTCDANDITGNDGTGDLDGNDASCDGRAVGFYRFVSLLPGTYTVCETLKTDWFQSEPSSGPDCLAHTGVASEGYTVNIQFGTVDSGNDFGNFQQATKSGRKFEDLQADGFTGDGVDDDSDPGLNGWTIFVYNDNDGDGDLSAGDTLETSVDTANDGVIDGAYSFTLDPGKYIVCEESQGLTGTWFQSYPAAGADCSSDVNGDGVADVGYAIDLESQEDDSGNDFGNYENATKSGVKFFDLDADATRDVGEDGLPDFEIHLFGTDGSGGNVHEHFITCDSDDITGDDGGGDPDGNDGACDGQEVGFYIFTVTPGDYTVCETAQPVVGTGGYKQTAPDPGADCTGHTHSGAVTPGPRGYSITLESGDADTDNNFGNVRGSLLIEKRAKSASAAGCSESTPEDCPLFGGATFEICPDPLDGVGCLTVTDDDDGTDGGDAPDEFGAGGLICIDNVILGALYDITETDANDDNYAEDDPVEDVSPSETPCADRTSGTADAAFFNTPLSVIRVTFGSLADGGLGNDGVTQATIECDPEVADSSQTPPGDDVGDATPAEFDDIEEIFTGLLPGTYDCQIVIDP